MNGQHPSTLKHLTTEWLAGTLIGLSLLGPACAETAGSPGKPEGALEAQPVAGPGELNDLMSALLTSQDRIALAEKLQASLRSGDLTGAKRELDSAIDVGTLAMILDGYLHNPGLLPALQDHGIKGPSSPPSQAPAGQTAASASCSASDAQLADLRHALEQEKNYSGTLSETLTDLMQENNALKTRLETEIPSQTKTVRELEQALQREQEQREATARELASLQEAYRALQEAQAQTQAPGADRVAELESSLQQERQKSADAARQLAAMTEELRALQAFKAEAMTAPDRAAELEAALAQERKRREALVEDLTQAVKGLRILQEPHQPSATPLVFRIAENGTEIPLPKPEALPPAADAAAPAPGEPVAAGATAAVPKQEPTTVVVASLPDTVQPLPVVSKPVDQTKASPPPAIRSTPPADTAKMDERLVARADDLLRSGDVSGARLLLERSLANGNARAAFLMAETFDPNVLSRLGVLGIRGDVAKAQEFYARARELGVAQAEERLEALK